MASTVRPSEPWNVLSGIISGVRVRWRLRLVLYGLTVVLAAALIALWAGGLIMQLSQFKPSVVIGVRVVVYIVLALLVVRYLVLPLRRNAGDNQVALYLEEHEPSLNAIVLSAVDVGTRSAPVSARSPRFSARVLEIAIQRASAIGNGANIETRSMLTSLLATACIVLATVLTLVFGPDCFRTAAYLYAAPSSSPSHRLFIDVQPGSTKVNRNSDQAVRAQLHGFSAKHAEIITKRGTGRWERIPMTFARDSAAFTVQLFNVRERTMYYIEAGSVRSQMYQLMVVDVPYVKHMTLEYHYPSYTGLPVKRVDNEGDIAALEGTSVVVRTTTTVPVQGARISIPGQPPIAMTVGGDGTLTGTIPVRKPGFYKIELEAANGAYSTGSLDYTIDVSKDAEPTIEFTKPAGDQNPIEGESVATQVKATDDYGVAVLDLHFSVNGGAERTIPLLKGVAQKEPGNTEVIADYAFILPELRLRAGDVVMYYAQATDNDVSHGGKVAKSDLYFLNVVATAKKPKEKQPKGGKGPPPPPGPKRLDPAMFLKRQRQIIVSTFKVSRDRSRMAPELLRENLTTLSLAQDRLRKDILAMVKTIAERDLASTNPDYASMAAQFPRVADEMAAAQNMLGRKEIHAALGPQHRALALMVRALGLYERNPAKNEGGGQGGADDEEQPDEPTARDTFPAPENLEMNQGAEPAQPRAQTRKKKAVDSLMEKLTRLAERQQRTMEKQKADIQQQRNQQGRPGQQGQSHGQQQSSQQEKAQQEITRRQLARDLQKVAEQLADLARRHPDDPALRASAKKAQDAANAMRQATAREEQAMGAKALQQLQEARRLLEQSQQNGAQSSANQKILDLAHDLVHQVESLSDRAQSQQRQQMTQQAGSKQGQPSQQGQQTLQSQQDRQGQHDQRSQPGQQGAQRGGSAGAGNGATGGSQSGSSNNDQSRDIQRSVDMLRHQLREQGQSTNDLDRIIDQIHALNENGPGGISDDILSASSAVRALKLWEFELRQRLGGNDAARPLLGGTSNMPDEYRELIDEYYRSLAKKQ